MQILLSASKHVSGFLYAIHHLYGVITRPSSAISYPKPYVSLRSTFLSASTCRHPPSRPSEASEHIIMKCITVHRKREGVSRELTFTARQHTTHTNTHKGDTAGEESSQCLADLRHRTFTRLLFHSSYLGSLL
ncbi:hypothetical protein J6590_008924 [Homalodisca vitripennis]|nr:hypothetical protein J6590_008924 [Homalodisca vitripennis]